MESLASMGGMEANPQDTSAYSEEASTTSSSKPSQSLWTTYCAFVRRNQVSLELFDAGVSRILFWTPTASDGQQQSHRQREVLYGILSLHRLAMDMALQPEEELSEDDYGTTITPNQDHKPSLISPKSIRISLTVCQSLLPSILELARSPSSNLEDAYDARQAKVRLYLERIKFVLRMILLTNYWKKMKAQQTSSTAPFALGILTEGGLYQSTQHPPTTVAQEEALWKRRTYVGRRTGRTVIQPQQTMLLPHASNRLQTIATMAGEVLYAYRPLYWAHAEASGSNTSYRQWLVALLMDLVSLQSIAFHNNKNAATRAEMSRRKIRLLLYLLRTPLWEQWTQPTTDRIEDTMQRVPILGTLASSYLRDWMWYTKHPYVAEQG